MLNINYKLEEIAKITKAVKIIKNLDCELIKDIIIDSRKINKVDNSIFIALKTDRNNGHNYINELAEKGLKNFIISEYNEKLPKANYIIVKDTLKALQIIGANHKKKHNLKTIAISGSNGKTIVKEWLYQLLSDDFHIVRSPKSYNSQIGVPLSVMQINSKSELGIFEAGISYPGEMSALEEIIKPDIGIFTNIGPAHAENFVDDKQKINEKLQLFKNVKTLIFCRDYGDISEAVYQHSIFKDKQIISWSKNHKSADVFIKTVKTKLQHSEITLIYNKKEFKTEIPFTDLASIENAINSLIVLLLFDYDINKIQEKAKELSPVAMRLELKKGINNCHIINDSYNSDINSLNIALDFLKQQNQTNKHTLIISDILQSGKSETELYTEISELIDRNKISKLIGIGSSISKYSELFNIEKEFYNSTRDFIKYYPLSNFNNETILLKGARKFRFEKINKLLEERIHETLLEVNLNSLVHNYNYFKSLLKTETKIMAMVKAFSYGSGSFELANILQYQNVDYLAVAYADEGVELRKAGISTPIMVMNPQIHSFDLMVQYKLEAEIFSLNYLNELISALKDQMLEETKKFGIHLKIETGMNRLGFNENELDDLIKILHENKNIEVKSVFSHLAASDAKSERDFTLNQIAKFKKHSLKIEKELGYKIIKHIANSNAIINYPEAHMDMVRLGISLYGFSANKEVESKLENVSSLKTNISQIKKIKKGDTIGYNRSFTTEKDMKTATIPIGYADGLNRLLSNGKGAVYIKGKRAKILGNVCMDMTMIDLSGIDAKEGDEVIVFDTQNHVKEIAKKTQTIEYEVLTSIGRRVKRVYFQE